MMKFQFHRDVDRVLNSNSKTKLTCIIFKTVIITEQCNSAENSELSKNSINISLHNAYSIDQKFKSSNLNKLDFKHLNLQSQSPK